jgi:hypothetical protein
MSDLRGVAFGCVAARFGWRALDRLAVGAAPCTAVETSRLVLPAESLANARLPQLDNVNSPSLYHFAKS